MPGTGSHDVESSAGSSPAEWTAVRPLGNPLPSGASMPAAAEGASDRLAAVIDALRHADDHTLVSLDRAIHDLVAAGKLDDASSLARVIERAAQITGLEAVGCWAVIQRALIVARQRESDALPLLDDAFRQLDATDGMARDPALLRGFIAAGNWLFERSMRERDNAESRRLLARMLDQAIAAADRDLEARIVLTLLWQSLSGGDLAAAEAHALLLADGELASISPADAHNAEVRARVLHAAASALYEAGEEHYESAQRIARAVLAMNSRAGPMLLLLALTGFAREQFADTLGWLDRLLQDPERLLPGYDVSSLHHRRTLCLLHLGRRDEARESINAAIDRAPEDPYVRFSSAQVFASLGDTDRELEAYAETIRLCGARLALRGKPEPPQPRPRTAKEYESNTPPEDLRDFAMFRYALRLRERGRTAEAIATLEELSSIADAVSSGGALLMRAEWAEDDGKLDEAFELLVKARRLESGRADEVDLRLATLQVQRAQYDQAIDLLVPLCHKSKMPEKCIAILAVIPAEWSGAARVAKWRGYARTEAGWPSEGFADLDAAVAADPSDAETLLLRALARLTLGIKRGQEAWNESRTMRHIRESLEDLYGAVRLQNDYAEARRVIQWLVERAAANPEMYEIFAHGGTRDGDLFTVFPDLRPAFETAWDAENLGFKRRFTEAAAVWTTAIQAFDRAEFAIMGLYSSLRLADVYLRLLELDRVAEHLERAERVRFLVDVPLSLDVLQQYQQLIASRGLHDKPLLGREVEYAWIYDHAAWYELRLAIIKGTYRYRIGDVAGALECADLIAPVLEDAPGYIGTLFGVEEVMAVVGMFRAGGKFDQALHLLDQVAPAAAKSGRSFDVLYARGLLHDARGESELAVPAYEQALATIAGRSRPVGIAPYLQYAASLLAVGRAADALATLQRIDIEREGDSDRDRLTYYTVLAATHHQRSEHADTLADVEKALAIGERRRESIADPESRRAWQGQQKDLFSFAVSANVATGQTAQAWRAVELSKARTLLDELEGRAGLSPEHTQLVDDLEILENALVVAGHMTQAIAENGVSASQHIEAASALASLLGGRFHDILASTGYKQRDYAAVKEILDTRHDIVTRKEREARNAASRPNRAVIDLAEVTELLREAGV